VDILKGELQELRDNQMSPAALMELQQELSDLQSRMNKTETKVDETAGKLDKLEEKVELDRAQTIELLADHCERHDFQSNLAKAHCVLITGTNKHIYSYRHDSRIMLILF
jgi:hypothetical protein